jgi:hypothetical protein
MAAPPDPESPEVPASAARRIYNVEFLERLGEQFEFDGKDPAIATAIIRMGVSYCALRSRETTREIQSLRSRYNKLASDISSIRKALETSEELALPELMYFSALQLKEAAPNGEFPDLAEHERLHSGEPYFRELLRLLGILSEALKENIRRTALKRGPRANEALESLAFKTGQFFARELNGRPFTIDPHKPFKPTKAFDFVKTLIEPLDNVVTDDEIITAIRGAKAKLRPQKK